MQQIIVNYLHELANHTTLEAVISALLTDAQQNNIHIYACGGIVRDAAISAILEKNVELADFDFMVENTNDQSFQALLKQLAEKCSFIESIKEDVGNKFPVWKIKIKDFPEPLDFALARQEESFGSHHREFTFSTESISAREDSLRRDFTINALLLELMLNAENEITAQIHDYHNGLQSIMDQQIVCVGSATDRFNEDPMRILRAVRFAAKLPGFHIEKHTREAIADLAPSLLPTIDRDRFTKEISQALKFAPIQVVWDMFDLKIFPEIFPELPWQQPDFTEKVKSRFSTLFRLNTEPGYCISIAALFFDLAIDELAQKFTQQMNESRHDLRFFWGNAVSHMARQARLPNPTAIQNLCNEALVLINLDFVKHPEATLEYICGKYDNPDYILSLSKAYWVSQGMESSNDISARLNSIPPNHINFDQLLSRSPIPKGPNLYNLKLCLRQAEIDGSLTNELEAARRLEIIYQQQTHIITEYADKISANRELFLPKAKLTKKTAQQRKKLCAEIVWMLSSKPVRLLKIYQEKKILELIFPELHEAEKTVIMTEHHFSSSFLNNTLIALGLLYGETALPSQSQILATIFLDIGMTETLKINDDGKPTYYKHDDAGAKTAENICRRLGLTGKEQRDTVADTCFIIRNHNTLIQPQADAENRIKKLLKTHDIELVKDLLLIHKIDQTAKMVIKDGVRIDNGQLDNYRMISSQLETWQQKILDKIEENMLVPFLSGSDLMDDDISWGIGLPQGKGIGELKTKLNQLQRAGRINSRFQAMDFARGQIVLYHLLHAPGDYIQILRKQQLLAEIIPELHALVDLRQDSQYHLEDAYTHTINVIAALPAEASAECRLAAIFHDIGKAKTQSFDKKAATYHFYGHEKESVRLFKVICGRFQWLEDDFNKTEVIWLIKNHIKVQQN